MSYKFLEHTADLKIQVKEKKLEKAFIESAMALKEAIAEKVKVKEKIKKKIEVNGKDKSALLYNFLEEFLYLLDADNFLIADIKKLKIIEEKSKLSKNSNINNKFILIAEITGDKSSNYKFTNNVKAITYNEMLITENPAGGTIIQFVLDV